MADIDLSAFSGNEFVFHFGGRPAEVDAYTFANSLLSFSEAIREINKQVNPGTKLEITIEEIGEGSFRAKLKTATSSLSALFRSSAVQEIARNLVIPLFVAFIYERYLSDSKTTVIVDDDSYVVQRGHDRIILPRAAYDKKKTMPDPRTVEKHIAKGFEVLEEDQSVSEFGITKQLDDPHPIATIPRQDFAVLSRHGGALVLEADPRHRVVDQREKLVVLRAILARSARKWQFVWNGIQISAAITDARFYDALARREYQFGQSDILDVLLRIYQERNDEAGVYINTGYEVVEVFGHMPGPRQDTLPLK